MYNCCPLGVKRAFLAKEGFHPLLLLCPQSPWTEEMHRAANGSSSSNREGLFVSLVCEFLVVHTFEGIVQAGRKLDTLIPSKLGAVSWTCDLCRC